MGNIVLVDVKIFDSNTTNNYQYNFEYYNKKQTTQKNYDFSDIILIQILVLVFLPTYGKTEDFFLLNADCTQSLKLLSEYGQQKSPI